MRCILNGLLWVPTNNVTQNLLEEFTYRSPFGDEDIVSYRHHKNGYTGFPAGSKSIIQRILNTALDIEDKRVEVPFNSPCDIKFGSPRDYQEEAIKEIIQHDRCIFTAPTSSGKTISIAFLTHKLKQKLLVVSHLTILLDQIEEEINMFLSADVGRLTSKSNKVHDISLVTVQTLNRSPKLAKLCQKAFGVVYVDEFDNLLSTNYVDAIQRLHAKRLILTSATPSRDLIGLTPLVQHLSTDVVQMVPPDGRIVPVTCVSVAMPNGVSPPRDIRQRARVLKPFFKSVRGEVNGVIDTLLLSKRDVGIWLICNIQAEQEYYAERYGFVIIASQISKKQREENLRSFKAGEVKGIIGSGTMSAGVSIPYIGFAIRICTHSSSAELLEQQIGRLRREYDGKERSVFLDLVFPGLPDTSRKKAYKRLNNGDAHTKMGIDKLLITLKEKLC